MKYSGLYFEKITLVSIERIVYQMDQSKDGEIIQKGFAIAYVEMILAWTEVGYEV